MISVKVGDLVRIKSVEEYALDDCHYSRPSMFPYNKVGLVIEIQPLKTEYNDYIDEHLSGESTMYPWDYEHDYGYYDYRSLYSDILIVLVEGQTYWMFEEEIDLESSGQTTAEENGEK
jgi:hypothetical protein|tara:strand:- start:543 stop:896 length:354 start_codon:yes stop_codon:yes gene_type:complete